MANRAVLRDERIGMIYEGTNHIQALDLVGRKLVIGGGRLLRNFQKEIATLLKETEGVEELADFHAGTKDAVDKLTKTSMYLMKQSMQKDFEDIAAVASEYLNVFGYTVFAFSWLMQCKHALTRDDAYAKTKLKTARYFFRHLFPKIEAHTNIVLNGKSAIMDFDESEL